MKHFNTFQQNQKKATALTYQYMVDFSLPRNLSQDFMSHIPAQRQIVNRLFRKGKLVSYALSLESSRMWAIFKVASELELMELLAKMPLTPLMDVEISCLSILNMPSTTSPDFSLN